MDINDFKRPSGRHGKLILRSQVEDAIKNTRSNNQAAKYLGINILTYRKYARLYGVWDDHSNKKGIGITKGFVKNAVKLDDVFAGKHQNYSLARLKHRMIARKLITEECSYCGFTERRIDDKKSPLILTFKDGDRTNFNKDNLHLVCYNCFGGNETFITIDGIKTFKETVGTIQTVLAGDGVWRDAEIKEFGTQYLQSVEIKPITSTNTRSKTSLRHTISCTPNHRWITKNRGEVTDLKVGDIIPFNSLSSHELNVEAWIRGFGFGDGTIGSANRAQLRLCGEKDKVHLPIFASYGNCSISYPPSTNGDPVIMFHKGIFSNWKELPTETDTQYLYSWLVGYLDADSHKKINNIWYLSSQSNEAIEFVKKIAPSVGFHVTGVSATTNLYTNLGKRSNKLQTIILRPSGAFKVTNITELPPETVYCAIEPITHAFTLASGALTGNCMFLTSKMPTVAHKRKIVQSFNNPENFNRLKKLNVDLIEKASSDEMDEETIENIDEIDFEALRNELLDKLEET